MLDALEPEHLESVIEHLLRETARRLKLDAVLALPSFPNIDQDHDLPQDMPGTYGLEVSFDCWHALIQWRGVREKRLIHAADLLDWTTGAVIARSIYEHDPDGWMSPHLQVLRDANDEPLIPVLHKDERRLRNTESPKAWRWVLATVADGISKLP